MFDHARHWLYTSNNPVNLAGPGAEIVERSALQANTAAEIESLTVETLRAGFTIVSHETERTSDAGLQTRFELGNGVSAEEEIDATSQPISPCRPRLASPRAATANSSAEVRA